MKNFDTGTVIAVCSLIAVLFVLIQLSVWPLKKDISRLEKDINSLKDGQADLKSDIAEIKQLLSQKIQLQPEPKPAVSSAARSD